MSREAIAGQPNSPVTLHRQWEASPVLAPSLESLDMQELAVLRYGATGNENALPRQQARDFGIGQGRAGTFGSNHVADQAADGGRGAFATAGRGHGAREEMLQLEDTERRSHKLVVGNARNG